MYNLFVENVRDRNKKKTQLYKCGDVDYFAVAQIIMCFIYICTRANKWNIAVITVIKDTPPSQRTTQRRNLLPILRFIDYNWSLCKDQDKSRTGIQLESMFAVLS